MRIGKILTLFILVLVVSKVNAQRNVKDSTLSFFAIGAELGMQVPMADLAERFGYGGIAGGGLMYKFKSNWTIEGNFGYIYGNRIKEDSVLAPIMTSQNIIIDRTGNPAEVMMQQRGFVITGRVGKVLPIIGPNPNSGLHLALGTGFIQHKIRIQDDLGSVPQLQGDYIKGYDRLTNGWVMSQSIGYQHFSNYRLINYYIGVEFYEGWTQNRRSVNYDTGLPDNRNRLDIMGTLVFRWYFPTYKRQPQEFYFY